MILGLDISTSVVGLSIINEDKELIVIERKTLQIRFLNEQLEHAGERIKELEDINQSHRKLNGMLRVEIHELKVSQSEHEKDKILLQGYKNVISDLSARLRKYES